MAAEDRNISGETCPTGLRTSRQSLLFSDIPAPAWAAIFVTPQHSYTQSETSRSGDGRIEALTGCLQKFESFWEGPLVGWSVHRLRGYLEGSALQFSRSLEGKSAIILHNFDVFDG